MSPAPGARIPRADWLHLARDEPEATHRRALDALADPALDGASKCLLHAVVARCALERLDLDAAMEASVTAVGLDTPELDDDLRGEVHATLASALVLGGDTDAALSTLARAESLLGPGALPALELQRCHVRYRRGELLEAFEAADRAVRLLPRDRVYDRARALNNRGVTRLYLGGAREGADDLRVAEQLYEGLDMPVHAADAALSRGMMAARLGDLPGALAIFARARDVLRDHGGPVDQHLVGQCEVLALAGLAEDVAELLPAAIARLTAAGMVADAAEGSLYLAMAYHTLGDPRAGATATATAAALSDARPGWAAVAEDLAIQQRAEELLAAQRRDVDASDHTGAPHGPEEVVLRACRVAQRLEQTGMLTFAMGSWLRAGRWAQQLGVGHLAVAPLARTLARRVTLADRVAAHEAIARLRVLRGQPERAAATAERGMRLVERNRSLFEATELRISASGWAAGIAELLVDLAWSGTDVRALLQATERWRATAFATRAPLPPPDAELAALLDAVRAAHASIGPLDAADPTSVERIRLAERAVTEATRARVVSSADRRPDSALAGVAPRNSQGGAGEREIRVSLVPHRGELVGLVDDGVDVRRVSLGALSDATAAAGALAVSLRRLAPAIGTPSARLLLTGARSAAARLDILVGAPLRAALPVGAPVVVVPVGELHAAPWAALLGVPVSVSPSIAIWDHSVLGSGHGTVSVVAGPGLEGAEYEARAICAGYGRANLLIGPAASGAALLGACDGAALMHVACHSEFRSAQPLLSQLVLSDGPVTAYELERLQRPPEAIVLSACATGRLGPRRGGELIGLATVLMAAGTSVVVSSVYPLPDAAAVPLFTGLHRHLLAGLPIASAVAAASAEVADDEASGLVLGSTLVCYGRGDWRLAASVTPGARTTASS